MEIKYFQKGFNYSQDGPGNRLIYHLHGCNLHCPWCSNPEGMKPDTVYPHYPVTTVSLEEITNEIISCKPMFFDGGGVTLTGGEVTLQIDAVTELFKRLKTFGINTCIETNAMSKKLPMLFPYLDHLIMDMKTADEEKLLNITGGILKPIIENLETAVKNKLDITVHIPLIHGFNDLPEDTELLFNLLSPFKNDIKIEFLPYHEYGKEKWEKCGLDYKMEDAFISNNDYKSIVNKFITAGFTAIKT